MSFENEQVNRIWSRFVGRTRPHSYVPQSGRTPSSEPKDMAGLTTDDWRLATPRSGLRLRLNRLTQ